MRNTSICVVFSIVDHGTSQAVTAIFSPHSSGGPYFVYTLSFCIFCSPIPVLSNGTCFVQLRGSEQKRAKKSRTPVACGTIEPFVYNNFPTCSCKTLQLETLDVDIKLVAKQNHWQSRRIQLLACWQEALKTHRKTRRR